MGLGSFSCAVVQSCSRAVSATVALAEGGMQSSKVMQLWKSWLEPSPNQGELIAFVAFCV
jgi:hypothetical protein